MTHDDSARSVRDEALVRDALKQAFDTPLTSTALAEGEAAVRSLAATVDPARRVVDIGGRRRRVAAAVAAGVFVLSSGAAAAGGGDPFAGARRVVRVIAPAPAPAPERPEVDDRVLPGRDDRPQGPSSRLVLEPSTTVPAEAERTEPVPPVGRQPVIDRTEPAPGSLRPDAGAGPQHPQRDPGEPDDAPTASEDVEDETEDRTEDQEPAGEDEHREPAGEDDDVELDDPSADAGSDETGAADADDDAEGE